MTNAKLRTARTVAAAAVLALLAAGCAAEQPQPVAPPETATPETTAPSTTPEPPAEATVPPAETVTTEAPTAEEPDPVGEPEPETSATAEASTPTTAATTTSVPPTEDDPRVRELAAALDVFTLVYDSDSTFDAVRPHLEDADELMATHAEYAEFGASVGGIEVVPTAMDLGGDTATITFDIHVAGTPYSPGGAGVLRLRDGVWIAPRSEFCTGMHLAGISCPGSDPEPSETTTESEPAVTPTTLPPDTTTPEPDDTTTPETTDPEPEQPDTTTENPTEPEQPADATGWSQYEPGQVVAANELWPGNDYAENFVCRINDEGTVAGPDGDNDCWVEGWQHYEPGQVVAANVLWPGNNYAANFVCRFNDEGTVTGPDGDNDCWMQQPDPTTPEPVTVETISSPLRRCLTPDSLHSFGSGHVAALVGTTDGGVYRAIVRGGADSCERIKTWFDEARQAEADRINRGDYPCEYAAPYYYWPRARQTAGSGLLVGCWPRVLYSGPVADKLPDPDAEARRLWRREGWQIMPPNHPVLIDALWDCYRDALEGPPTGWMPSDPSRIEWTEVWICNAFINAFGNPVRGLGVTPECAAEQLRGRVVERRTLGSITAEVPRHSGEGTSTIYAGDWSWANCATMASGLLSGDEASYRERCEAVVDASAGYETDLLAGAGGVDHSEVVAVVKAMFCADGTKQTLREQGDHYQPFVPHWTEPAGEFVAYWTPGEGAVCYEAAMLVAAHLATSGRWTRVVFC